MHIFQFLFRCSFLWRHRLLFPFCILFFCHHWYNRILFHCQYILNIDFYILSFAYFFHTPTPINLAFLLYITHIFLPFCHYMQFPMPVIRILPFLLLQPIDYIVNLDFFTGIFRYLHRGSPYHGFSIHTKKPIKKYLLHFKREWRRYFTLLILVATNQLYREFRFLHRYISDVWFWQ